MGKGDACNGVLGTGDEGDGGVDERPGADVEVKVGRREDMPSVGRPPCVDLLTMQQEREQE